MGKNARLIFFIGALLAFVLAVIAGFAVWLIPEHYASLCTIEALPEFAAPARAVCSRLRGKHDPVIELKHYPTGRNMDLFYFKVLSQDRKLSVSVYEQFLAESKAMGNPYRIVVRRELKMLPATGKLGTILAIWGLPFVYSCSAICLILFILALVANRASQPTPPPLPHKAAKFDEY